MADIKKDLTQLIGHTPLMELGGFCREMDAKANIIGKLEMFNPLGSAKDRVGYAMILDAEQKGILTKETVIIEPTSGNTGVGLAFVSSIRGYPIILTMPENMSIERRRLLSALGAEIVLTPAKEGMNGAIKKAFALCGEIKSAFMPGQFENYANPKIHKITTGPEIIKDTHGKVDIFVAGIGTGGTITGVGQALKAFNKNIKIIGVEPAKSAVLSGQNPGPHGLQGIGAGFIPKVLEVSLIDEIMTITEEEAFEAARKAAKTDGVLVGISSGAALSAALKLSKRPENEGKNIVVFLPDSGERYLSTELFSE